MEKNGLDQLTEGYLKVKKREYTCTLVCTLTQYAK